MTKIEGTLKITTSGYQNTSFPCVLETKKEIGDGSVGPKGDKGDPLTYDDLTEAQKAELARPATEQAEIAVQQLEAIHDAIDDLDPSQSTSDAIVAEAATRASKDAELEAEITALGPKIEEDKEAIAKTKKYVDFTPYAAEQCSYSNWSGTGKIQKSTGTAWYITAECQEGDMFYLDISSRGEHASGVIWNIIDDEDELVRRSGAYNAVTDETGIIIIPANGAKLIVSGKSILLLKGNPISRKVAEHTDKINMIMPKVGLVVPTYTIISDKYLYLNGTVNNVAGGCLTSPFSANKGDKVKIRCANYYNTSQSTAIGCVLAKCTGDNQGVPTGITPILLASGAGEQTYEYTLTEDSMLCVSYRQYASSANFADPFEILIEKAQEEGGGGGDYVENDQGSQNSGKLLGVGADGMVTLVPFGIETKNEEQYAIDEIIKNGSFSSLDNWDVAPANAVSVVDGYCKINTSGSVQVKQTFTAITSGHKLYVVYKAYRGSSAVNPRICFGNSSNAFKYMYDETVTETPAMFSHLIETTTSVDRITLSRNGNGSYYYITDIRLYDLTAIFGEGEEPTSSECDTIFNGTSTISFTSYVEQKISTIKDIKENQLSEAVQIKLNSGGGGGGSASSKWLAAKIGVLGDSITAADNNLKKYYRYMEDYYTFSGVSIAAISGATISSYSNPFYNRVTDLASDCDLIVVLGGINDFNHGVSLGELCTTDGNGAKSATSDTSTFYGALHTMVQALIDRFPTKTIVLCTPLHSGGYNVAGTTYPSSRDKNSANKYLSDYVDAIKAVGEWYSIPVLDLYAMSGFNPNVSDWASEYFAGSGDLLHPNTKGHALIANRLEGFLASIG